MKVNGKYTRHLAVSSVFGLFIAFGGAWMLSSSLLPDNEWRVAAVLGFGALFVGMFAWLLVLRVRSLLGGPDTWKRDLVLAGVDVLLLVVSFAWAYRQLGITDASGSEITVTNDFFTCLYYSFVTFTTLGYGDFYPIGPGRALAVMESMTGYLILGVLASTAAQVLSPKEAPAKRDDFIEDDPNDEEATEDEPQRNAERTG